MRFLVGVIVGVIVGELGVERVAHSLQAVIDFIKSLVH